MAEKKKQDLKDIRAAFLNWLRSSSSICALMVLITFLIVHLVLRYTRFGRNVYATGGNPTVARMAGINVDFYKTMLFVILGFTTALSAILMAMRCVTVTMNASRLRGSSGGMHCQSFIITSLTHSSASSLLLRCRFAMRIQVLRYFSESAVTARSSRA